MSERTVPIGFALAVLLAAIQPPEALGQDWRTLSSSRQVAGEEALRVEIEYAAGILDVRPAEPGVLYSAHLRYDSDIFRPTLSYHRGSLTLDMEGEGVRGGNHEAGNLELALGEAVPLDLELRFGAGRADVELGGLRIRTADLATGASEANFAFSRPNPEVAERIKVQVGAAAFRLSGLANANAERLDVEGGVGEIRLDFTGEWRRDLDVRVKMGLGALRLSFPRGLGVRVRKSGLLTSFDSQLFTKRGDWFYSEGWNASPHQLTLDLEAAFSSVEVRWVDDPAFAP